MPTLLSAAKQRRLKARFETCKKELSTLQWISEGSVTSNNSATTWRWTRKVRAKTVTVALSPPQAAAFQRAVQEHRRMEGLIKEMRALSQELLLHALPGPNRRPKITPSLP